MTIGYSSSIPQRALFDDYERLSHEGLTRVIGVELKMRSTGGPTVELGMWVPERELIIPNVRFVPATYLELPLTVHTAHGDLNLQLAALQ